MYTCARGSTPARVLDLTFSADARWLSMSTNHGTTHLFAVTPYGGRVSVRTHGGVKLVNKETGFTRSAGLADSSTPPSGGHSPATHGNQPTIQHRDGGGHPVISAADFSAELVKSTNDPRLPSSTAHAITLVAAAKVHQSQLTAANLSSRAVDLSSPVLPSSLTSDGNLIASSLGARSTSGSQLTSEPTAVVCTFARVGRSTTLYVMSTEGCLTEYRVDVRPAGKETTYTAETDIKVRVTGARQWLLQRTKSTMDARPPFASPLDCPLVHAAHIVRDRHHALMVARSPTGGGTATSRSKRCGVRPSEDAGDQRAWLAQIEMRTYSAPARRVWLGPQFTFKTLDETSAGDGGKSVKLVAVDADDPPPLVVTTGKKGKKKNKNNGTSTPPTLPTPPSTQPLPRSQPMHIGGRSVPVVLNTGTERVDSAHNMSVALDVCGSWSDNDYISCEENETRVRRSIADAMHEAQSECPTRSSNPAYSNPGGAHGGRAK